MPYPLFECFRVHLPLFNLKKTFLLFPKQRGKNSWGQRVPPPLFVYKVLGNFSPHILLISHSNIVNMLFWCLLQIDKHSCQYHVLYDTNLPSKEQVQQLIQQKTYMPRWTNMPVITKQPILLSQNPLISERFVGRLTMLSDLQERLGELPPNDDHHHRSGRNDQHVGNDTQQSGQTEAMPGGQQHQPTTACLFSER